MRVSIAGLATLRRENERVRKRLDDGDVNVSAALPFFDAVSKKFDSQGPGWRKLSDMRIKARGGSDSPILDWTGNLRKAATSWTDQNGLDKVEMRRTGGSASMSWELSGQKVDNQSESSVTLMAGGQARTFTVPARPFWPIESDWEPTADAMLKPADAFADGWAAGNLRSFDARLKRAKNRKRTR